MGASAPLPGPGQVDLWQAMLDLTGEDRSLLSADERERAERFAFDPPRRAFVAARSALRQILAPYAGLQPGALRFGYGPHGKPHLAGGGPAFSLTHSGDRLLVAVTGGDPVGVDLEPLRPVAGAVAIARQYFPPDAAEAVATARDPSRSERFLAEWTRLEAAAKWSGEGVRGGPPAPGLTCRGWAPWPGWVAALATAFPPVICHFAFERSPSP